MTQVQISHVYQCCGSGLVSVGSRSRFLTQCGPDPGPVSQTKVDPDPCQNLPQCCGSMTFLCGSGSADTCLWLMDTDPAVFIIDLQDANKKQVLLKFFCILLFEGTFTSFLKDKKSKKRHKTVEIKVFSYYFCLMIEGSGYGSRRPKTCGSGFGFLTLIFRHISWISTWGMYCMVLYSANVCHKTCLCGIILKDCKKMKSGLIVSFCNLFCFWIRIWIQESQINGSPDPKHWFSIYVSFDTDRTGSST